MDNYRNILQKVANELCSYYEFNKNSYEAYDSFVCAIKKHNTDTTELRLNVGSDDLDYRKILIQIITDLRFAKWIDLGYDEESAGYDSFFLRKIMEIISKEDEKIYDEFFGTCAISYEEYRKVCEEYGLPV